MFLCIRCAGIHRNLGVHISRVKSVNLDSWTPEQVVSLQNMGNSRARAVYEAQLPDGFRRPQTDSALESFIRSKYEHKKYMAREWVPSPPAKVNWDKEIDEELERQKRKKKSVSSLGLASTSTPVPVKTPLPAPLPKPKANVSSSPKSSRTIADISSSTSALSDLLGLSSPTSSSNGQTVKASASAIVDLSSGADVFSNFLSAAPITNSTATTVSTLTSSSTLSNGDNTIQISNVQNPNTLAKEEADFFNQVVPSDKERAKMTKDSILALYGTPSTQSPSIGQFNGFNQFPTAQPNFVTPLQMTSFGNVGGQFNVSAVPASTNQLLGHGPNQNYLQQQQHQVINGQNNGATLFSAQPGFGANFQQQSFAQFPPNPTIANASFPVQGTPFNQAQQLPPPSASVNANLNQQFGNLNLGNVWQ